MSICRVDWWFRREPGGGTVHARPDEWVQACDAEGCLRLKRLPSGAVVIASTTTGQSIIATSREMHAFFDGVRNGD